MTAVLRCAALRNHRPLNPRADQAVTGQNGQPGRPAGPPRPVGQAAGLGGRIRLGQMVAGRRRCPGPSDRPVAVVSIQAT